VLVILKGEESETIHGVGAMMLDGVFGSVGRPVGADAPKKDFVEAYRNFPIHPSSYSTDKKSAYL